MRRVINRGVGTVRVERGVAVGAGVGGAGVGIGSAVGGAGVGSGESP